MENEHGNELMNAGGYVASSRPKRTTPPNDLISDRRKKLQVARGLDTAPHIMLVPKRKDLELRYI